MKYQIKYSYRTGDSFGNSDEESTLDLEWDNLDIAKENLKRIKEHYQYYEAKNVSYIKYEFNKRKAKIKEILATAKDKDWYSEEYDFCLILKTDDGKDWKISAPWCGYFETLYGAEIIGVDSDLKFEI